MMSGEGQVITGWKNKMQVVMAKVLPATATAEYVRKQTEPGSGSKH